MEYLQRFVLLSLILFISACSTLKVDTKTTAFYQQNYNSSGNIFVVSADIDKNNSLEFANYKKKIETQLAMVGYSIVNNANAAQYVAIVAYGIDNGKTSVVLTPIFGPYAFYTDEDDKRSAFPGRRYVMPQYAATSKPANLITLYTISFALDIVEAESLKPSYASIENKNQAKKVYESRVKSIGECDVIAGVFDQLLAAMFKDFPGENGKTKAQTIRYEGEC